MNDDIKKMFDPETLPKRRFKRIAAAEYDQLRTTLCLSFAFPHEPERIYEWDDPHARRFLFEFQAHGGKEILVDEEMYLERIKKL